MDTARKTNTLVLTALSLSTLLASLATSSANVALPTLTGAFDSSFGEVQWVVLAYLLAMTAVVVTVGRLGDRIGRRRLLVAGILVFTAASAMCAVAPTLGFLVLARAGQGMGAAAMTTLAIALVGQTIAKGETGRAMGWLGTMSAVGTALGPSLGGVLLSAFGWRAIFLVNLPLGVLAAVLAARSLPAMQAARSAGGFDKAGMVLLGTTLAAYTLAMTGRFNAVFLAVAVVAGALFLRAEARAEAPLVRLALFRNPALAAGFAMSALVTTVVMATLIVGPFYLSGALGLTPAAVGAAMSVGPIVAALAGVPSGRLVDRFGSQAATLAGLAAMASGSAILALTPASWAVWGYIVPLVVVTAGYALFQASNSTAVTNATSQNERGVVSGLLGLSRNLGLVTGASAMGSVFALAGSAESGMHLTFAVAAILMALGLVIAMVASNQAGDAEHAAGREQP